MSFVFGLNVSVRVSQRRDYKIIYSPSLEKDTLLSFLDFANLAAEYDIRVTSNKVEGAVRVRPCVVLMPCPCESAAPGRTAVSLLLLQALSLSLFPPSLWTSCDSLPGLPCVVSF